MSKLISTIKCHYKFFKQPDQIGDVIEVNKEPWLIIGIEGFKLTSQTLFVWYTCQNLSISDYVVNGQMNTGGSHEVELEAQLKFNHEQWDLIKPGSTTTAKDGNVYRFIEYTEISLKGTDLYVSITARRVYPVNRKKAKAKFIHDRKKKLKLEVH
ncbi:hypothetical protein [Sporosarcina sp. FSL W7-1283]|uniref:hypothetical protein n=1 Tax=Sporosarcina sp. FSL W7-1283 TaxID=2921560 RepID=UPI0030FBD442